MPRFRALSEADINTKSAPDDLVTAADLAAEALITTAAGLLIALSAVIPQSMYNRWSDEIELEMQEANSEIIEFILTHH